MCFAGPVYFGDVSVRGNGFSLNYKEVVPSVVDACMIDTGLLLEFVLPPAIDTQHGFLKVLHFGLFFSTPGVPKVRGRTVVSGGLETYFLPVLPLYRSGRGLAATIRAKTSR
jgi:hypothetical protein